MAEYRKSEARDWASLNMRGVANIIIPTFTQDLQRLNEGAIRYDVRKDIEYGFWGTLLVSETSTTRDEYIQFVEWARDESGGRLRLLHQAGFNTLEENIAVAQAAESAGADLILLTYPPTFYPESSEEIYEFTKTFCENVNLGVMLFPVPFWGFERVHPAGMSPELLNRLVDDVPNIVAIKAEGGYPSIAGFVQTFRTLSNRVVVTFPAEDDGLPLATLLPMQFMGTSNTGYYGPMVPRIFSLIQAQEFDQAMELFWQIHPARLANMANAANLRGTNFLHRLMQKYQGWLSGFNGGPLRMPTMRIVDGQMKTLRQGLISSGLEVAPEPDRDFFLGRNPA